MFTGQRNITVVNDKPVTWLRHTRLTGPNKLWSHVLEIVDSCLRKYRTEKLIFINR